MTLLIPLLAFAFISVLVTAGALALAPGNAAVIRRRLGEVSGRDVSSGVDAVSYERVVETMKKVGRVMPKSPSEMGKLQLRLVHAGFRRHDAIVIFLGIRAACALVGFLLVATPLFVRPSVTLALGAAALGYVIPGIVLARTDDGRVVGRDVVEPRPAGEVLQSLELRRTLVWPCARARANRERQCRRRDDA